MSYRYSVMYAYSKTLYVFDLYLTLCNIFWTFELPPYHNIETRNLPAVLIYKWTGVTFDMNSYRFSQTVNVNTILDVIGVTPTDGVSDSREFNSETKLCTVVPPVQPPPLLDVLLSLMHLQSTLLYKLYTQHHKRWRWWWHVSSAITTIPT